MFLVFFIQVVIMPISTVLTVICRVPQTVETTRVTYKQERVLSVMLVGPEYFVTQVRRQMHNLSYLNTLNYWGKILKRNVLFSVKQNVLRDGMVWTVVNSVRNIAKTVKHVITWLVTVKKDVPLGGQDLFVTKVYVVHVQIISLNRFYCNFE